MRRVPISLGLGFAAVSFAMWGCGGGSGSSNSPMGGSPPPSTPGTPAPADAQVTGPYNLVLTSSTNGHGTTNVYSNFVQRANQIQGSVTTLVCPGNDASACRGNDESAPITPLGMVAGANVSLTITFPSGTGTDTLTLEGTEQGKNLTGTYTDSLGDSGTWTGASAIRLFVSEEDVVSYSGTFNSTANPLMIAPTILLALGNEVKTHVSGSAMITNSPCIGALNLSGQQIGDALWLQDDTNKTVLVALPTDLQVADSFAFSYKFDASAASCAGDAGKGTFKANASPWDY